MLITVKEYAARHGVSPAAVRQKCERGGYKTAQKPGRDWLIDEDEEYTDLRMKSGRYVGQKAKLKASRLRVENVGKEWSVRKDFARAWFENGLEYPIHWEDIEYMAARRGIAIEDLMCELDLNA